MAQDSCSMCTEIQAMVLRSSPTHTKTKNSKLQNKSKARQRHALQRQEVVKEKPQIRQDTGTVTGLTTNINRQAIIGAKDQNSHKGGVITNTMH